VLGDPPAEAVAHRPSMLGVGTIVWLGSEVMFFGGLFAAYFTLRAQAQSWPPAGIELETVLVTVFTVVLVASSGTMHLAHGALAAGDSARLRGWLAATLFLGALFVANQVREFATLEYSISTGAYGSIYYLMVGFHALHVAGGLALLGLTLARTGGGRVTARDADMVEATSYYWHFVDVVWIGMFTTIFVLR
jgi:cytochrome c oxidase subunit III